MTEIDDGNLLFGVLALREGLLARDLLLASVTDWSFDDRRKSLGQLLVERRILDAQARDRLDAQVRAHLERNAGDPGAGLDDLGPVFDELRRIVDLDTNATRPIASVSEPATEDPFLTRPAPYAAPAAPRDQDPDSDIQATRPLGYSSAPGDDPAHPGFATLAVGSSQGMRYRVLRPHAKGGLGVVHVAYDQELNREVALKEIRDRHADDPNSRSRFVVEAEITGGLEHPGIVPVYGLGQYEDGRPYYAMRFIQGNSLQDAIEQFRRAEGPDRDPGERALALRKLLRCFVDVCNAIEYAHSRGVLHRDLKPGNIMMGKFGETLVVDWGLAKALDRPEIGRSHAEPALIPILSGNTAETLPGAAVGTPQYMSPEQSTGSLELLGPASDVYSLGATLYAVLAGRSPFDGVKTVGEVLERVQKGDFPHPRKVDPSIAPAMEAVCLKAMALRPEDRYASARALADDIERWLADEPVLAWREPWSVRARRWIGRHQTAVAAATAAFLGAAVLGTGAWFLIRSQREARIARTTRAVVQAEALARSKQSRAHAGGAGQLALWDDALAEGRRAEAFMAGGDVDRSTKQRIRDLIATLKNERAVAVQADREEKKDRSLLDHLSDLHTRRGGEFESEEPGDDYRLAFKDYGIDVDRSDAAGLAARVRSRPPVVAIACAAALDDWAAVERASRREGDRSARLIALARKVDPDPWRDGLRATLLVSEPEQRRENLKKLADFRKLADLPAASITLLAKALSDAGVPDAAAAWLRVAQRHHPGDVWINYDLATILGKTTHPEPDEAIRFYTAARALRPATAHALGHALENRGKFEEAVDVFRDLALLRPEVARYHVCLGEALRARGAVDQANAEFDGAIKLARRLVEQHAADAKTYTDLGLALAARGDVAAAVTACREAVRLAENDAKAHHNLGVVLNKSGDRQGAIAEYRRATQLNPDYEPSYCNLGSLLRETGDIEGAIAACREAIRLRSDRSATYVSLGLALAAQGHFPEAIDQFRTAVRLNPEDSRAHANLGLALAATGGLDAAIAEYRRTLEIDPKNADVHSTLGDALSQKGDVDGAIAACKRAIGIDPRNGAAHCNLGRALQQKGDLQGATAEYRQAVGLKPDLAMAHNNLGGVLQQTGHAEEAIAEYRKAIDLKPDLTLAYYNLGVLLRSRGEFAEAVSALMQGRTSCRNDPAWDRRFSEWIQRTQHELDLDGRLAPVLRGESVSPDERIEFAQVCRLKGLYAASARLYDAVLAGGSDKEKTADKFAIQRFNAASAAALAGSGQGRDDPAPDEAERLRWRTKALEWLRADLSRLTRLWETGTPQDRRAIAERVRNWPRDPNLAVIRDDDSLANRAEAERESCRAFWADLDAFVKRAGGRPTP